MVIAKKAKVPEFTINNGEADGRFEENESIEHQSALMSSFKGSTKPKSSSTVKRVQPVQMKHEPKAKTVVMKQETIESGLPTDDGLEESFQTTPEKGKTKPTLVALPSAVHKVWNQFATTFEQWAAAQQNPFDIDDASITRTVHCIYEAFYGETNEQLFIDDCDTVKLCKQWCSQYKNGIAKVAVALVEQSFNQLAVKEFYNDMSQRVEHARSELADHGFLFKVKQPRSSTFMSTDFLIIFSNHFLRMRQWQPIEVPALGDMIPIGGLALAAAALFCAFDLYKRVCWKFQPDPPSPARIGVPAW
ncbi:hypothetical protein OBBRIDRAFT_839837 [Obba rivulosa]|uniref:Uncharacterized protein n=1 Tax=Obba rivulosa TaxID=1052685 RepID=A0A8E2DF02_9APHY|nr:hypothetical protein OBBRIDRAFT_839837 [Obba rivulosa]